MIVKITWNFNKKINTSQLIALFIIMYIQMLNGFCLDAQYSFSRLQRRRMGALFMQMYLTFLYTIGNYVSTVYEIK